MAGTTTTHTHHRRNSSLSQRKAGSTNMQKFTASLPRLPPSPLLPNAYGTSTPNPSVPSTPNLGYNEKLEDGPVSPAWLPRTSRLSLSSPRSSTSSSRPIKLDDYRFSRAGGMPISTGGGFLSGVPKQVRRQVRWLVLLALLATCVLVVFWSPAQRVLRVTPLDSFRSNKHSSPVVPAPGSVAGAGSDSHSRTATTGHRGGSWRKPSHKAPGLSLNIHEELAVVTAYIAALPENRIPDIVDPKVPLDPQLILDFDVRGKAAKDELNEVVRDVWHRNPVVVFGKHWSADTRAVHAILDKLNLAPAPTVFEVNQRPDGAILETLLERLANATTLPLVLIGGNPVGGLAEISILEREGTLPRLVEIAGAKVDGKKKKGGRKH